MKYFFLALLFGFPGFSFAVEAEKPIGITAIQPDYPADEFGEGFEKKKISDGGPSFLSNGQSIRKLVAKADLKKDLKNWSAFDVDQLLLRTYYLTSEKLNELYPQLNSHKLKNLKQALVDYESK